MAYFIVVDLIECLQRVQRLQGVSGKFVITAEVGADP